MPAALSLLIAGFESPHGPVQKALTAAVATLVVLALAEASWRWLEQPALGLKRERPARAPIAVCGAFPGEPTSS